MRTRESDSEYHKKRYRHDARYRQTQLDYQKAYRKTLSSYPEWRHVCNLRKKIHHARESYENQQAVLARMEARLVKIGVDLVKAERAWAKIKERLKSRGTYTLPKGDMEAPAESLGTGNA